MSTKGFDEFFWSHCKNEELKEAVKEVRSIGPAAYEQTYKKGLPGFYALADNRSLKEMLGNTDLSLEEVERFDASLPFAKGYGWGGDLNLEYIFEKLYCEESGQGYPRERAVPENYGMHLWIFKKAGSSRTHYETFSELAGHSQRRRGPQH